MALSIHETIKEIKKEFRLSMNGVVSTLQRRQGLDYRINFGIEVPRLKRIAAKFPHDEELARTLWKENIRECKLLAIYLLPEASYPLVAEEWIAETRFTEIADLLSMHILYRIPEAAEKALEWTGRKEGLFPHCGYMTLTHLFRSGHGLENTEEEKFLDNITTVFAVESSTTLRRNAYNSLLHYIDIDGTRADSISNRLKEKGCITIPEPLQ
ncbi:MAG: DNA alkylation repair protein [Bacteroidaceae bacterium]|nr:DNA alkylation repair protein [Bacteroidaceae bacterium]